VLTGVLASIPVAFPPPSPLRCPGRTRTSRLGRAADALSAVDEAANIDVLCADKTGTLTLNALT